MDYLASQPLNLCVSKAGLAAGTTTTVTITNNTTYSLLGKAYTKTAASNATSPTTDAITGAAFVGVPINYGCAFVYGLDSSGNIKVAQSGLSALDVGGNFVTAPQLPTMPDSICPIGYLITKVGATGATWTMGSSNLAGPPTGVTHTFVDCLTLPGRPQVA